MIRIGISAHALRDLDDGYWFYEHQESGLGDYFASTLKAEIEELRITAGIHRQGYLDYFRLFSRVFPYAIYYTFSRNEAVVRAVVDCRRDPDWIRRHLGE